MNDSEFTEKCVKSSVLHRKMNINQYIVMILYIIMIKLYIGMMMKQYIVMIEQ